MHVVDSGTFFDDPERVYDDVLSFLGLRNHGYPVFERHNARPRAPMPESLRAELSDYFAAVRREAGRLARAAAILAVTSSRTANGRSSTRYRRNSRRGSLASRQAHSSPAC